MITLDATTKSLEIDLTGAVTTNQLPFVACYVDISQSTFAMSAVAEQDGTSNNTTAVTCLSAPGASTSRVLKFFSWKNSDTAAREGWIQLNNNGTLREIWKGTLQVGDTLFLVDASTYCVIDANGNIKTTVGTVPTSVILGTTTNDSAAAGRLGEFVESSVTSVTVTTSDTNITSISLTAGDWDVAGVAMSDSSGATTGFLLGIGTTSATIGGTAGKDFVIDGIITASAVFSTSIPRIRFSLSATTTVYLVGRAFTATLTTTVDGYISARRAR